MIKNIMFGKSLRQLFIILLISFFGLFVSSFVKASALRPVGVYSTSIYDNNYDIQVINKGSFLSNMLGSTKDVFMLRDNTFFIWDDIGNIYIHFLRQSAYGSTIIEGYPDYYFSCDELTGGSSSPSNCTPVNITSGDSQISIYSNFLKSVGFEDNYLYNITEYWSSTSVSSYQVYLCISSHSIGKSICWAGSYHSDGWSCPGDYFGVCPTLHGSVNLGNVSFGQLNGYPSPAVDGSVGSDSVQIDFSITGDYVSYDCTYRDILTLMNTEGYNKYICYGGLDNFNLYDSSINYSPIPGSGLSISQIWAWSGSRAWDNFSEWFHFWNGIYLDDSNNYNSMWESYPAVYRMYFQLFNTYNSTEYGSLNYSSADYILNYCQLMDNLNNNNFNLDSSVGGQFKPFCEVVVREKQTGIWDDRVDGSIYSDGVYTGNVPLSVNWGTGKTYFEGTTFIQDFYNKTRSHLIRDNGSTPIIPSYILLFLFAVIIFKFLRK